VKLWKSWVIATKDFSTFREKKNTIYPLIVLPLLFSIGLPILIGRIGNVIEGIGNLIKVIGLPILITGSSSNDITVLLNSFSFFYIMFAFILPSTLASYSILGEKIEKSLEPLLATPITDTELLLGKIITSFLPCVAIIYFSAVIFMVLSDAVTYNTIGYLFFPNWNMAIILLLAVPLVSILSIQLNVIISSRVSDVRTTTQLGLLLFLPFIGLYIFLETSIISLNIINLLGIFVILFVVVAVIFSISKAIIQRDKIITKRG
jgi:ABC-type Na+ efflux pump permease subunit